MTQLTENLTSFKELREKTGASLSDSKKALEESNGDITKAYEWLFQNSNTFIATGEISFQIAMQEINKRLSKLREINHHATNLLKEAETTIKTVSQEFIQLEPDLVKLGKNAFNSGEWTISQNHNISKLLNQISVTKIKLSDAEVGKTNRQEESKKGFWSRVKVAVGDILDQTESLKQQLHNEYIDLAKIIITSSDNNHKLNEIALESLVIKIREIDLIKISAEANQNSALSTLTQTKHDIGILSCTAKKNLHVCTDIAQFEECMQGFDLELCEELRKHTNKILATNLTESVGTSASTLADGVFLVAKGVNGQLELLEDKIRIKRQGILSFMNHGFKGDKEILIERISAIQFKNAGSILSGYIQFSFMGSQEAKGGLFDASKDENTVVFTLAEQDKFEQLKHRIEQKMIANRTGSQQLSTSSNFDDLEKLANLRDKGIITEEEFQVKKRQILGL